MTTMKWPNPIGFRFTNGCPIKSTRKGSNQSKHCQREKTQNSPASTMLLFVCNTADEYVY